MEENENMVYALPKEGTNLWFDNIVIPKTSKNEEAAYKFINFMLKPENAAKTLSLLDMLHRMLRLKNYYQKKLQVMNNFILI